MCYIHTTIEDVNSQSNFILVVFMTVTWTLMTDMINWLKCRDLITWMCIRMFVPEGLFVTIMQYSIRAGKRYQVDQRKSRSKF